MSFKNYIRIRIANFGALLFSCNIYFKGKYSLHVIFIEFHLWRKVIYLFLCLLFIVFIPTLLRKLIFLVSNHTDINYVCFHCISFYLLVEKIYFFIHFYEFNQRRKYLYLFFFGFFNFQENFIHILLLTLITVRCLLFFKYYALQIYFLLLYFIVLRLFT